MASILKNSIAGQRKGTENFCLRGQRPRKLKTVTQAEQVGIEAGIRRLDAGVG